MPDLQPDTLRRLLPECLAVPRWVDEVAGQAPFADLESLLESASLAAAELSDGELEQALSHHPRIGERIEGDGAAQQHSRAEQASHDADDVELADALVAGNREYEERFDRVFLIRAAGRSRAEILGELRRRIELDEVAERQIVVAELRDIALLRIRTLWAEEPL